MPKDTAIVYWLMPAKSERELFRQVIRILAKEFDAPQFEPHLTLLATRRAQPPPAKILQAFTASPVRLRIRGTAFSGKFTQTLFVRFESNQSLEKLSSNLGQFLGMRINSPRDPHVSLLYKKLPARIKKELAAVIKLPFSAVTFDSVAAVRCVVPAETGADVQAWRVIGTNGLSG